MSLGVSSGQQQTGDKNGNEVDLILDRAGYFVTTENEKESMRICPRHKKIGPQSVLGSYA